MRSLCGKLANNSLFFFFGLTNFGHRICLTDGRLESALKALHQYGREAARAASDETDGGNPAFGQGGIKEDGMYRGHCGVPRTLVASKVCPKAAGGEALGNDDAAAGTKRGQEAGEKTVDVEQGHDEI